MAREVYTDVYPQWLIENDIRPKRRRTAQFRIAYDASKVAGYSFINPLTGTNYAYKMRVDSLDLKEWGQKDYHLKRAFVIGSIYTALGLFYAGLISKPGYWYPLVVLLVGVAGTELWAYKDERGFMQFKTVGEYQQGVANDYASSTPFKNMVDEAYGGDIEYYATKTWFMSTQDKISRFQGCSLLFNVTAGFAFHRSIVMRLSYAKSVPFSQVLAGGAAIGPVVYSDLAALYYSYGPDGKLGGAQTSHWSHGIGFVLGMATSVFLK